MTFVISEAFEIDQQKKTYFTKCLLTKLEILLPPKELDHQFSSTTSFLRSNEFSPSIEFLRVITETFVSFVIDREKNILHKMFVD